MRICMTRHNAAGGRQPWTSADVTTIKVSEWPTETTPSRRQCRPARLGEGCLREASAFPRIG